MSRRAVVSDYAGNALYAGDLITYSARVGNRVRAVDAIIRKTTARRVGGRLQPLLLVEPTGVESGFVPRSNMRTVWVSTEHARLIQRGYDGEMLDGIESATA